MPTALTVIGSACFQRADGAFTNSNEEAFAAALRRLPPLTSAVGLCPRRVIAMLDVSAKLEAQLEASLRNPEQPRFSPRRDWP